MGAQNHGFVNVISQTMWLQTHGFVHGETYKNPTRAFVNGGTIWGDDDDVHHHQ